MRIWRLGGRTWGRWLAAGAAAAMTAAALPAVADAADYCVAPNTACGGTNVATFEQALSLAAATPAADRIFLGAATYTAPTTAGFTYDVPAAPVEIVGAGTAATTVTAPAGAGAVMFLHAGPGSSIHDLRVHIPANVQAGTTALTVFEPAQHVSVDEDPSQTQLHRGVVIDGAGSFVDGSVSVSSSINGTVGVLVDADAPGATVERAAITGHNAVSVNAPDVTLDRLRLSATSACLNVINGPVRLTASLLLPTSGGTGLSAVDQPANDAALIADGVTIAGDGSPGSIGAGASSLNAAPRSANITVRNSIISGVQRSLTRFTASTGAASVTAQYSDYDPAATQEIGSGGGALSPVAGSLEPGGNVNLDPRFVSTGSDFHLASASPLIDLGDPGSAQGVDLDGNTLIVDGNGDGIARRDMGAYELPAAAVAPPGQPQGSQSGPVAGGSGSRVSQSPLVSGFRAVPSVFAVSRPARTARVARGTHFRYSLSEDSRVTITIERALAGRRTGRRCVAPSPALRHASRCTRYGLVGTLAVGGRRGSNSTRFAGTLARRALTPGAYRAVITAIDATGRHSAARDARFRVVTTP